MALQTVLEEKRINSRENSVAETSTEESISRLIAKSKRELKQIKAEIIDQVGLDSFAMRSEQLTWQKARAEMKLKILQGCENVIDQHSEADCRALNKTAVKSFIADLFGKIDTVLK